MARPHLNASGEPHSGGASEKKGQEQIREDNQVRKKKEKKKVRQKKEAAHLSVRLYFLLSLLVSCCLAGYVCGEI